ncbi:glycosyltransferase family 4 protein [Streptomyces nodosus]|uniref:glycosyltransferase family 4 protein n=1 Tax=Streptomyces nodosus TaxID=40318 RepID=UPI0034513F54
MPGECEGDHPADLAAELDIERDVFFIGWRGHEELPAGLNCADLMVAPAVNEPFGMVYLEAMACGTPPIATTTGGPARTIKPAGHHATGWLVAPDDPHDLARTLTTAIQDTAERQRRGTNGRQHIQASASSPTSSGPTTSPTASQKTSDQTYAMPSAPGVPTVANPTPR